MKKIFVISLLLLFFIGCFGVENHINKHRDNPDFVGTFVVYTIDGKTFEVENAFIACEVSESGGVFGADIKKELCVGYYVMDSTGDLFFDTGISTFEYKYVNDSGWKNRMKPEDWLKKHGLKEFPLYHYELD